jgi:hypothetical protein
MSQPSTGSSRARTPQPLCPHRHGRRCRSVSLLGQVVVASWSTVLHASSDRTDAGVVGEQDAPRGCGVWLRSGPAGSICAMCG